MESVGRTLVLVGLGIAALGGLALLLGRFGIPFGRLPGDVAVQRPGFSVFVPITSMIVLSALATGILWLVGMLRR